MKIIETQAAVVSNLEALAHVRRVHERYEAKGIRSYSNKGGGELNNLYFALTEVKGHLESTPTVPDNLIGQLDNDDTETVTKQLMPELSKFDLTKAEKLMILNLKPYDGDQLATIIEEASERFSDEQLQQIASHVVEAFRAVEKAVNGSKKKDGDGKGQGKAKVNGHG